MLSPVPTAAEAPTPIASPGVDTGGVTARACSAAAGRVGRAGVVDQVWQESGVFVTQQCQGIEVHPAAQGTPVQAGGRRTAEMTRFQKGDDVTGPHLLTDPDRGPYRLVRGANLAGADDHHAASG